MDFFHHNTIRKYTASLLDTFNDVYIQRTDLNNDNIYHNVPITFGSKDKAFIFSELDNKQWLSGNYNILPRMSLTLLSIDPHKERNTNRLHTINKTIEDKVLTFQYNAVAYNFDYQLDIATKSLTELSMILEQVLPHFNPSLNLSILELDIQDEPTSIKVQLNGTDLDLPDSFTMDADLRIVGAKLKLKLHGNLYFPFKDGDLIKQVRLYLNRQDTKEILGVTDRKEKIEFEVQDGLYKDKSMYKLDFEEKETVSKNAPNYAFQYDVDGNIIRDVQNIPILSTNISITGLTSVIHGTNSKYELLFIDHDDEKDFTYVWNILSGNAAVFQNNVNPVTILFGNFDALIPANNIVVLQGQVIDKNGNISSYVTKTINIL